MLVYVYFIFTNKGLKFASWNEILYHSIIIQMAKMCTLLMSFKEYDDLKKKIKH